MFQNDGDDVMEYIAVTGTDTVTCKVAPEVSPDSMPRVVLKAIDIPKSTPTPKYRPKPKSKSTPTPKKYTPKPKSKSTPALKSILPRVIGSGSGEVKKRATLKPKIKRSSPSTVAANGSSGKKRGRKMMPRCPICEKKFKTAELVEAHFAAEHVTEKTCTMCFETFDLVAELGEHVRLMHEGELTVEEVDEPMFVAV
jgi:hypothetical protein